MTCKFSYTTRLVVTSPPSSGPLPLLLLPPLHFGLLGIQLIWCSEILPPNSIVCFLDPHRKGSAANTQNFGRHKFLLSLFYSYKIRQGSSNQVFSLMRKLFCSLIRITETRDPIKKAANFILDISGHILSGISIN